MGGGDYKPENLIVRLTMLIALSVAILIPAGYFAIMYNVLASSARTEAAIKADAISQIIASTPEMWKFQDLRLKELLRRASIHEDHWALIVDHDGVEVTSIGQPIGFFSFTSSVELFDAGVPVGRIKLGHSLYGVLAETVGIALLSVLLGVAVFMRLQSLVRYNEFLNEALFKEKARAETTLQSIADAVITIGVGETVEYLNPAAETLTGWTLAEAGGRPISEVLRLIDEQTLESVAHLSGLAMGENCMRPPDKQIVLLQRDGSMVAIEDHAAPIPDSNGRVSGGVIVLRDVSAARSMAKRLTLQATTDSLTGAFNRLKFDQELAAEMARSQRYKTPFAVVMCDIDNFKDVNDTYGHQAGDQVLVNLVRIISTHVRTTDVLARWGGEEFMILASDCDSEQAVRFGEKLRRLVEETVFETVGAVTCSFGVAQFRDGDTAETLTVRVDGALYAAKLAGRNQVCASRHRTKYPDLGTFA